MQVEEDGDDFSEPRFSNGSMLCLHLPTLSRSDNQPRRRLPYNMLPPVPLTLTVLKLDGSSFGIKVAKTGKVRDLKQAVETVFHHFPKKGPGKIPWDYVWGQFCLCYDGQKLLDESDYIIMYGIQDGDQIVWTQLDGVDYLSHKCISEGRHDIHRNGMKDDIYSDKDFEDKEDDFGLGTPVISPNDKHGNFHLSSFSRKILRYFRSVIPSNR